MYIGEVSVRSKQGVPVPTEHAIQYLSRNKWLQALSTHKERDSAQSCARGRRKHVRFRMDGWAVLTFESPDKPGAQTACPGCQVLDVSEEGIALRANRKLAPNTAVSIEMHVSGRIFWLSGKVVYHVGMAGSIRIGIKLQFDETDKTDKRDGA